MKINDIKEAYDSVSANGELKEKVFSRLYAETEDFPLTETFPIEVRKGGETRLRMASFVAAAAMIAMALIIGKLVFNVDISDNLPGDETETTSETVEIAENTALVTLAEGSFGELKQNSGFRRFLCRGKQNVEAESILLALAHNMNKLHHKIQAERTGTHLFSLKNKSA